MQLQMQSERGEHGQYLVELDGWLAVLQGADEAFGYISEVCELVLPQPQNCSPRPQRRRKGWRPHDRAV